MATTTRRRAAASSRRRSTAEESSGGRLNRDYSDEEYREPGEGYNGPQPKKGLYPAKLVSINDHTSGEGNESVRWGFELTGGTSPNDDGDEESVAGFRDYQYTNDSTTLWREQQIAVALGLVKPNGKLNLSYAAILKKAKPCTVRIIRERYIPEDDPDNPEWRAKIAAVLSHRDSAKKTTRRRADEDDEDVFDGDDEDGDDDEDAEEETPPPSRSRSRRKAEPEPEPEEDEGDEEDWPEDPDELAEALETLDLAELKQVAKDDFGVTIKRGMKADAIIDAVLETLDEGEADEDDEDEPEEEPPPPPKRSARAGRASAKAGAGRTTTRSRKRGDDNEPPF